MTGYDIIALIIFILAACHVAVLLTFLKVYLQGEFMSIGYRLGFGGPKYITPFVTWFIED